MHQAIKILVGGVSIASVTLTLFFGYALVALNIPDQYTATTKVYMDPEILFGQNLSLSHGDTETRSRPLIGDEITVLKKIILSRPNLRKLARMTDLDLRAETAQELEKLLNSMAEQFGISGKYTGDEDRVILDISYRDYDPEQAKSMVQSTLALFVESTIGEHREDNEWNEKKLREALQEEQVQEVRERLAEHLARLKIKRLIGEENPRFRVIEPPRVPHSPESNHQWIKTFLENIGKQTSQ